MSGTVYAICLIIGVTLGVLFIWCLDEGVFF